MQKQEKSNLNDSLKILAKSSFVVFIGIIISKIATYLYKIITARTFGAETYGLFSLAIMLSGLFAAIFSLGLQSGLLRYISFYRGKNEKSKIQHIIRFSLFFTFPLAIISGVLFFILSGPISINIFHNSELIIFLRWFAIFLPILLFGGIFHTIIRAHEKIKSFSFIGNILSPTIQLIFLLIFIFMGLKNNAIIFSYNLGIFSILIVSFIICRYNLSEIFEKSKLEKNNKSKIIKDLFSYSWPVLFFGLAMAFFGWIDSFAIGYFKNASDVGIYNAAVPLALIFWTIPALFLQLFFPLITKEYSRKNLDLMKQLSKQIGKWIFILNFPIFIILMLFPGAVINLLFGAEFIAAENALRFLSIGVFFYSISIISENLLSVIGKSKTVLMNLVIAAITNIFLNLLLVPRYGINGAAFSTMVSYFIFGSLSLFLSKRYTSIIPFKKKMIKIFILALIPTIMLFFIRRFFDITPFVAIFLGIFFILLYFFLILVTKCFDENDLVVLRAIKHKFSKNKNPSQ